MFLRFILSCSLSRPTPLPHRCGACCGCTYKNNCHFTTKFIAPARGATNVTPRASGTGIAMVPRAGVAGHESDPARRAGGGAGNAGHGPGGHEQAAVTGRDGHVPSLRESGAPVATKYGCFGGRDTRNTVNISAQHAQATTPAARASGKIPIQSALQLNPPFQNRRFISHPYQPSEYSSNATIATPLAKASDTESPMRRPMKTGGWFPRWRSSACPRPASRLSSAP